MLIMGLIRGIGRTIKIGFKSIYTGTGMTISIIYGILILIIALTQVFSIIVALIIIVLGLLWAITQFFITYTYKAGSWMTKSLVEGSNVALDFADNKLDSGKIFSKNLIESSTNLAKNQFQSGKQRGVSGLSKIKKYFNMLFFKENKQEN